MIVRWNEKFTDDLETDHILAREKKYDWLRQGLLELEGLNKPWTSLLDFTFLLKYTVFGSDKSSLVARYFISLQAVNINKTNLHD